MAVECSVHKRRDARPGASALRRLTLRPDPGGGAPDPADASFGPLRVCRGGSWFDDVWACRAPTRAGREPANRYYDLGLRPAFSCE